MKHMFTSSVVCALLFLSGCGFAAKKVMELPKTSGGRSAIIAIDALMSASMKAQVSRRAALLGVFISEYVSFAQTALAAQGALTAIAIDTEIMTKQNTVTDPDFDLLQAFADALQVNTSDLLNRSTDRQQTLDTYATALTNVASRANQRYQSLTDSLNALNTLLRTQSKERSDSERALQNAIRKKDFSGAGELQKAVLEKQQAYAETDLKRKQTDDVVTTLNSMLTLYKEKIFAIGQNREILISGNHLVDVPGIEELNIIERKKNANRTSRKTGKEFDTLFEGTGLL